MAIQQISVVSFYGEKPSGLQELLETCRKQIKNSGTELIFNPYSLQQIHATLIGLEMHIENSLVYSVNYIEKNGDYCVVNLDSFRDIISHYFPMRIRIGGFPPDYRSFLSLNKSPYERSFTAGLNSGKVVLMGWPQVNDDFTSKPMLEFRNDLEVQCRIAHKYSNDNDFYMVLGEIERNPSLDIRTVEQSELKLNSIIRESLLKNPVDITVSVEDIYLVMFTDTRLPAESTKAYKIADHWEELPNLIYSLCNIPDA